MSSRDGNSNSTTATGTTSNNSASASGRSQTYDPSAVADERVLTAASAGTAAMFVSAGLGMSLVGAAMDDPQYMVAGALTSTAAAPWAAHAWAHKTPSQNTKKPKSD